ncbi:SatD family protein [Thiohalocapsa sp. ML1]|jgi:hypothetical protein|uniref:SatD family protein n=1 Tax=Thiohalocapsa sp. ML1 TaxID=1431688 RepID=UPI000732159A|nr:SatD family protein [Thiohalocapsa sp. ML1]
MPHLVVIADVIASRGLPDRAEVQRALQASLAARNAEHRPQALLSPYTLTLGDEFQAVPARAQGVFRDLLQIAADLQPVQLRFALGLGDIATGIDHERAIGMDGSAFHLARAGVEGLKHSDGRCRVEGLDGVAVELVNQGLALAFGRLAGSRGSRLALAAGLVGAEPIADIATRLDRTEQTLYKTARSADLYALAGFLHAVEALLDERLGAADRP